MLFKYFFQKFFYFFLIYFTVLIAILAASDVFLRLPVISSLSTIPKIFFLMMPLMAQFAIPIASSLAVQIPLGSMYIEEEIISIYYFSKAKKIIYLVTFIFSLIILLFYVPIVTRFAPKSYKSGKQLILNLAKEHFSNLQANRFHTLSSNFTIFFKKQIKNQDNLEFLKLLLLFKEKNGEQYIVNASKGYLTNEILILNDGFIQNISSNSSYISNFEKTEINLKPFLNYENNNLGVQDLKFFTLKELKKSRDNLKLADKRNCILEIHKRYAQVLWQFLIPFISLFLIMLFAKNKSNLLISLFSSGLIFLLSYILLNTVKSLSLTSEIVAIFYYLPPIIFFVISFYFFNKKIN